MPGTRTRPDPTPGQPQRRAAGVRAVDKKARTIEVVASTETLDAHGTVLLQDWDLSRYERNPVVLWAHDCDEVPIGRGAARVEDNQLVVTIEFAPAAINPFAETVFQHYAAEFLRAVSVGFDFKSYRWEERDGVEVLVLFGLELFELSCVPVGSNPDALARAMAARSNPGPKPTETDHMAMTDEERKLWELGRRTLELLNEKDPAAAEASLRGTLDNAKAHEGTEKALAAARAKLGELNRAAALDAAVREGRLPPRAEWTEEQAAYLAGLDAIAPAEGQRSPLDAYLRTLTPRAPVGPKHQPEGQGGEGARAPARSVLGTLLKSEERAAPHLARARAEKRTPRGVEKVS
jgi:HK97 family phage prohead protease